MKTVNIIGKGPGWNLAPESGENWGVNDLILRRNVNLTFHMHNIDKLMTIDNERDVLELIFDKTKSLGSSFITLERYSYVPNCIEYPLDEIVTKFKTTYFGSSLDFMMAYAIHLEYEKIILYGVNMVLQNEYLHQKPSLEFWIGLAKGKGIEVDIISDEKYINICQTFNEMIYGYDIGQFKIS